MHPFHQKERKKKKNPESFHLYQISSEPIPIIKVKGNRKIKYSDNSKCTVFSAALVKADLCRGLWIMKDAKTATNFDCQKQQYLIQKKGGKKKHCLLIYQGNNIMYYMQKQSHLSRYMISQYIKIQVDFDWFLVNKHEK